jgi:hypothetical protein
VGPAVIVALAPAAGYGVAYAHEFGYLVGFRVPTQLISLQLSTVLVATATLFLVAFFLFASIDLYYGFRGPGPIGAIEGTLLRASPYLVMVMVLYVFAARDFPSALLITALGIFYGLLFFGLPALRKGGSYRERLRRSHVTTRPTMMSSVVGYVGRFPVVLGFIFFVVCVSAFIVGDLEAALQQDYLVPTSRPSFVVVREYGDTVILVGFEPRRNRLDGRLWITKVGDPAIAELEWRSVGRLR